MEALGLVMSPFVTLSVLACAYYTKQLTSNPVIFLGAPTAAFAFKGACVAFRWCSLLT